MTREEHTQMIRDIQANATDVAKVTDLLTKLSDDYVTVLTEKEKVTTDNEVIKKDNENLRDTNMRLFLKVGVENKVDDKKVNEPDTPKFEDLFNEKGGLK